MHSRNACPFSPACSESRELCTVYTTNHKTAFLLISNLSRTQISISTFPNQMRSGYEINIKLHSFENYKVKSCNSAAYLCTRVFFELSQILLSTCLRISTALLLRFFLRDLFPPASCHCLNKFKPPPCVNRLSPPIFPENHTETGTVLNFDLRGTFLAGYLNRVT